MGKKRGALPTGRRPGPFGKAASLLGLGAEGTGGGRPEPSSLRPCAPPATLLSPGRGEPEGSRVRLAPPPRLFLRRERRGGQWGARPRLLARHPLTRLPLPSLPGPFLSPPRGRVIEKPDRVALATALSPSRLLKKFILGEERQSPP